jgi:hypothetical protein
MRLELKPISLRTANDFVDHHDPFYGRVPGCKFSVGGYIGAQLVGVVIVGRPKARHLDDGWTLELTRVSAKGNTVVAAKLIEAATAAAFALGTRYVLSYRLASEDGEAFRAAGWDRLEMGGVPMEFGGGEWSRPSRQRDLLLSPIDRKHRWERYNAGGVSHLMADAA